METGMTKQRFNGIRILAAGLCALLLSGCAAQAEYPPALAESTATPPPVETKREVPLMVELYFRSTDGRTLSAEQREVAWPAGTSRAQAALSALCDGPNSPSLAAVVPSGLSLKDVELSGDVCHVYFTGSAPENTQELLIARAAIAATVRASEGILYSDIYINGMQPGYNGRPLGVLQPVDVALDVYLADIKQESVSTEQAEGEAGTFDSWNVPLYFSDAKGELLLCDVRTLPYSRKVDASLVITTLLGELAKGPVESNGREPILPIDMRLNKCVFAQDGVFLPQGAEEETVTPPAADEPGIVELYFSRPSENFDEMMVYASIVYTVTGFWPKVEGVRIYLDDELVDVADVLGLDISPHTGFTRTDFAGMLGHTATLAFPDQDGLGLYPVLRCMPQHAVYDPLARLRALFTGPADPGVPLALFAPEDALSVSVQGNTAVVNWKPGFYEKLAAFVDNGVSHLPRNTRAQMVVFAVVNTLAGIPGIERVWMLEDGQRINKSIDMIYLGNALFYNPGLMLT